MLPVPLTKNPTGTDLTVHTVHLKPLFTLVHNFPHPFPDLSKFVLYLVLLLLLLPAPLKLLEVHINLPLPFQVFLLDSSLVLHIPHHEDQSLPNLLHYPPRNNLIQTDLLLLYKHLLPLHL